MQRTKNQEKKFFGLECCVMEVKEFKNVHGNIKKLSFKIVRFFKFKVKLIRDFLKFYNNISFI